jgi:hypothetical protein
MGIGSNQMMQVPGTVAPYNMNQSPSTMFAQYVQPNFPSYAQYKAPYSSKKGADKQPSSVDQMIKRAQAAYKNINPATLEELFPALNIGLQQSLAQPNSFGANRFLQQAPQQSALLNSIMNPGMNMASEGQSTRISPFIGYREQIMNAFQDRNVPAGTKAMGAK